jgi:hypothetical protein
MGSNRVVAVIEYSVVVGDRTPENHLAVGSISARGGASGITLLMDDA